MTRRLVVLAVIAVMALMVSVTPAAADPPSCNWGTLTADAIAGGFPQGPHSSDPSGDGHGPGTADEPRVGLANVVERGDLNATCEFISGLLP